MKVLSEYNVGDLIEISINKDGYITDLSSIDKIITATIIAKKHNSIVIGWKYLPNIPIADLTKKYATKQNWLSSGWEAIENIEDFEYYYASISSNRKIRSAYLNINQKCFICNLSSPHSLPNKDNDFICKFCVFVEKL